MQIDLFEEIDYKEYLIKRLGDSNNGGGRGSRSRVSNAIGCRPAYIAQVLRGFAHLNADQAEGVNVFFGHTDEQARYFNYLVQLGRAGTPILRKRIGAELNLIRETRQSLKNRLGVNPVLTPIHQMTYYSAWYYSAIHMLLTIPKMKSEKALQKYLRLSAKQISDVIDFLIQSGLVVRTSDSFELGATRIHLPADSPWIAKHHANWRFQAVRSLEKGEVADDLHYSSIVTLSVEDSKKIREILVQTLENAKSIIKISVEEKAQCLSIDFFEF